MYKYLLIVWNFSTDVGQTEKEEGAATNWHSLETYNCKDMLNSKGDLFVCESQKNENKRVNN